MQFYTFKDADVKMRPHQTYNLNLDDIVEIVPSTNWKDSCTVVTKKERYSVLGKVEDFQRVLPANFILLHTFWDKPHLVNFSNVRAYNPQENRAYPTMVLSYNGERLPVKETQGYIGEQLAGNSTAGLAAGLGPRAAVPEPAVAGGPA